MHDEAVQLKILQTALTLMQSTTLAQNEVGFTVQPQSSFNIGIICKHITAQCNAVHHATRMLALQEGIAMVLGICFRLLANAKNTDSVTNTAAATVRQVCKRLCKRLRLCSCCTA